LKAPKVQHLQVVRAATKRGNNPDKSVQWPVIALQEPRNHNETEIFDTTGLPFQPITCENTIIPKL
jgi:hypothetical protein